MDKSIESAISGAIADANRYPFLFIGSGLSRRYADAPDWRGLLSAVCDAVLDDGYAFSRYCTQAKIAVRNGTVSSELPYVATLMEDDVNNALFTSPVFGPFRSKHDHYLSVCVSPMKLYVADMLSGLALADSDETRSLSKAGEERVSGVITTNYDKTCESLFPSFKTYIGERDLLFSEQGLSQEIYEIHGSISEPDTMVLTNADYAEFDRHRKYLAAKLLTIFIEYPVVFLGYSIQDENVRAILEGITECLPPDKMERLQRRMVFVQHGAQTSVGVHSMAFGDKMLSMTRVTTDDFPSIYEALTKTRKTYSARFIRELRGNVFRLAERIDPKSEIVTSGFDAVLDHMAPDQSIAIQVAIAPARIGRPISREEIFQDVLLDDLHMDPRFIVDEYLNGYVQQFPDVMPVFKYVQDLGDDVGKPIAKYLEKLTSLDDFRNKTIWKSMDSTHRRFAGHTSVAGLAKRCAPDRPFYFIVRLYDHEIDVDELEAVLKEAILSTAEGSDERNALLKNTSFRKCVRMYDFLRYAQKRKSPDLHIQSARQHASLAPVRGHAPNSSAL